MKTSKNYQRAALYHLQRSETQKIFAAFNAKAVPVIAFKGVTLQERLYDDPESREMCDIDILVRDEDIPAAEVIMQELGYAFYDHDTGFDQAFARTYEGEISYHKSAMLVEVHWELIPLHWVAVLSRINIADVWSRALPVKVAGQDALRLCAEDEVIHLCFHAVAKHGLDGSHGTYDILGVLKEAGDTFDWHTFVQRAEAWHVRIACRLGLECVNNEDASIVPDWVLAALRMSRLQQAIFRALTYRDQSDALRGIRIKLLKLFCVDTLWDFLRNMRQRSFPGRHFVQLRYQITPFQAFFRQFIYPLDYFLFKASWKRAHPKK